MAKVGLVPPAPVGVPLAVLARHERLVPEKGLVGAAREPHKAHMQHVNHLWRGRGPRVELKGEALADLLHDHVAAVDLGGVVLLLHVALGHVVDGGPLPGGGHVNGARDERAQRLKLAGAEAGAVLSKLDLDLARAEGLDALSELAHGEDGGVVDAEAGEAETVAHAQERAPAEVRYELGDLGGAVRVPCVDLVGVVVDTALRALPRGLAGLRARGLEHLLEAEALAHAALGNGVGRVDAHDTGWTVHASVCTS
mmetsp:Transcript_6847/g.19174  ORF Transcript_6847/g.19174 Transcript_6847/m.19174 type:complete len:254 (-) Transcript_6847:234-995(-)